jgi:uncharacterized protein (TIGR02996 family)
VTDRDALLAAALDRPNDDLPRLVLADYLQDHGEDDLGRFVRAGVVAARFRGADLIHDPEFYAATAEIAAVAEAGVPARWVAAVGLGPAAPAAGEWAWDHVCDRVTIRLGNVAGIFERGMLTELAITLEQWYMAAPVALLTWPLTRGAIRDVPGLTFGVHAPDESAATWRLSATLRVPGRRLRLGGGLLAAALSPDAFLAESEATWTAEDEFPDRAALVAAVSSASARLTDDLKEVARDRWPMPRR